MDYWLDVGSVTKGGHTALRGTKKNQTNVDSIPLHL